MNDAPWLGEYFTPYRTLLTPPEVFTAIGRARDLFLAAKASGGKLIFAGNGASASIASHLAVDLTKQAGVPAITFNEPNLITAFANDFGYENWVLEAIRFHARPGDVMVLISSSGKSPNIVKAAQFAKDRGHGVVTLSGFAADNPLRAIGDVNLWVDSRAYNVVECIHMIWLTAICDLIIGRAEYSVKA